MTPDGLEQVIRSGGGSFEIDTATEHALASAISAAISRPFVLETGPLMRVIIWRVSERNHVLALAVHHIVSDAWSTGILWRELSVLYAAHLSGGAARLPLLPLQYADYAIRQREALSGRRLAQDLAYWTAELEGAPTVVTLPTDRRRPAVRRGVGARERFTVPPDLVARLRAVAVHRRATLFMVALSAFQMLVSRYAGQRDLILGIPVAGRTSYETESLIGLLLNTLPIRAVIEPDATFEALLDQVRRRLIASVPHQELPLERLISEMRVERNDSHTPLVQVMFSLQNTPRTPPRLHGVTIEPIETTNTAAKLDLTMALDEKGDVVTGRVDYDVDLFDRSTIRRFIAGYLQVLDAVATDCSQRISAICVLTPDARSELMRNGRGPRTPRPVARSIHHWVSAWAARDPDRVAVVSGTRHLTYRELNDRANRLARLLRRRGVERESRVGLALPRGADAVVGMLGVLKAGGAYVPLDGAYPPERLRFMLVDSGVSVVVTTTGESIRIGAAGAVICLDSDAAAIAAEAGDEPGIAVEEANLAYVIYTSGSSGRPKGVAVEHRQILHYTDSIRRGLQVPAGPVAFASTFGADLGYTALFPGLCSGNTVHIVPDDVLRDGLAWRNYFCRHAIAALKITPSHLNALLGSDMDATALPSEQLVLGGEASSWEWVARLSALKPACRVFNHYGPTECTVGAVTAPLTPVDGTGPVPLGRPLPNVDAFVVDATGELAPPGVWGELYIGGGGVARGYLGRPALTAERFVPNPFSVVPGARLYRSGDAVRWRGDGQLEFRGRLDDQVKIRGFRIEQREIEAVLREHDEVADALVAVHCDDSQTRLVAYVVVRGGCAVEVAALRAWLSQRLPDYMVPSSIAVLDTWPLTPNGKLDRSALAAVTPERRAASTDHVTPRTAAERIIAQTWSEILGVPHVGVHDNFFELGGDSILAIQVVTKAARRGVRLKPLDVFEHQTVATLAACNRENGTEEEQAPLVGPVPLAPVQLWFFDRRLAEPHHYNQAMLLEPREPVDPSLLERIIADIITHHDAFQLRYHQQDGTWHQHAVPSRAAVPFEYVDLAYVPRDCKRAAVDTLTARAQASLDLVRGPLARFVLIGLGGDEPQRLLIVMHHLIVDAVSWRILLDDLETAYRQVRSGGDVQLPLKTASLRRWCETLAAHAQFAGVDAAQRRWLDPDVVALGALPRDENGANTEASARSVRARLSREDTERLVREIPRSGQGHVQEAILAALVKPVTDWTGQNAVCLTIEGHGRYPVQDAPDVSRTIGWFTTMRPALLKVRGGSDAAERIASVRQALESSRDGGVDYACWRYLGNGRSVETRLPSPDLTFNYLGQLDQMFARESLFGLARERPGFLHSPTNLRTHVLEVGCRIVRSVLEIVWTYSTHLHRRSTIEALAAAHRDALRRLIWDQASSAGGASCVVGADVSERDLLAIASALNAQAGTNK